MKNNKKLILLVFSTGLILSSVASASFLLNESVEHVYKNDNNIGSDPIAYIIGKDEKYTSVEKALDAAVNGDIVTLIPPNDLNFPSVSNPDKVIYTIKRNCIIKPGVTLLIPTDNASIESASKNLNDYIVSMRDDSHNRTSQENSDYGKYASDNQSRYLRVTLKIENNVTIENYGSIIVSGYLGSGTGTGGIIGQTSHSYSQILLGSNSKIVQKNSKEYTANNASIYCFGYISEAEYNNSSKIILNNGNLYVPFIIEDYRGFFMSWGMTIEAIDKYRASPFNQFFFKNIDCLLQVHSEASVYSPISLYVSYSNLVTQSFPNLVNVVGKNSDTNNFIIELADNGYLNFKYDIKSGENLIDFYGGFKMKYLDLVIDPHIMGVKVNLSTENAFFPISYRFNISLNNLIGNQQSTYDISEQRIKLLPGSKLTVNDYVKLIGSDMSIYTSFSDGSIFNGPNANNSYNNFSYPQKEGAKVILNGNNINLNFNSLAGTIFSNLQQENLNIANTTIESYETWSFTANPGGSLTDPKRAINNYLIINEKLNVVPKNFLNKKLLYCGINTFSNNIDLKPSYRVKGLKTDNLVDSYQTTLFFDEYEEIALEPVNNLSILKIEKNNYKLKDRITPKENQNKIVAINSGVPISNNNGGINEFIAQEIVIEAPNTIMVGTQDLITANITDYEKIYDKNVKWSTTGSEYIELIPETDQNKIMIKGKKITTSPITITAECNGLSAQHSLEIIDSADIKKIEDIQIRDQNGVTNKADDDTTSAASYDTDDRINFSVWYLIDGQWVNESEAVLSIEWNLDCQGVKYCYLVKPGESLPTSESDKVLTMTDIDNVDIYFDYSGASADKDTLSCTVNTITGDKFTRYFRITHNSDICFAKDTLIQTQRGEIPVESLKEDDLILSFNHFKGELTFTKISLLVKHPKNIAWNIKIEMSNGANLCIRNEHSFFDKTLNRYVTIAKHNAREFIGHSFVCLNKDKTLSVQTLENIEISLINEESYSLITYENYNCFANSLLNITPDVLLSSNAFEFDNLKYNKKMIDKLINEIGLMSKEEFLRTYPFDKSEQCFYAFNLKFAKIYQKIGVYNNVTLHEFILIFNYLIQAKEAVIHI